MSLCFNNKSLGKPSRNPFSIDWIPTLKLHVSKDRTLQLCHVTGLFIPNQETAVNDLEESMAAGVLTDSTTSSVSFELSMFFGSICLWACSKDLYEYCRW